MARCKHDTLWLDVSPHAAEVGFSRPPLVKRKAATTPSGRATGSTADHARLETLYPGPLVLPDDALALDPKEPPQSLRSWANDKMRNPLTEKRKTIYVIPAPGVSSPSAFSSMLKGWKIPLVMQTKGAEGCQWPDGDEVENYLKAFYWPLPVTVWRECVQFIPWVDDDKPKVGKTGQLPRYVGLQVGDSVTRITTRRCPDETFRRQLSLNDLLDAAIEALPDDAAAMVLLTDHDLYEDDDDDFCCGRAYGNSRIAVVSSARYNPELDESRRIDRAHVWPFSHCAAYVLGQACQTAAAATSAAASGHAKCRTTAPGPTMPANKTQLSAMVRVIKNTILTDGESGVNMWLSRLVRTVSHELGHCLCLDHCSYYACVMQSTASIAEDLRQPPYLCPVCEAKLARAIRDVWHGDDNDQLQCMFDRYDMLAKYCAARGGTLFAAYGIWLRERIAMMEFS
ncbi:hypothetical protein P885DRAFT_71748 [Corynascus similis CBS 632.67]